MVMQQVITLEPAARAALAATMVQPPVDRVVTDVAAGRAGERGRSRANRQKQPICCNEGQRERNGDHRRQHQPTCVVRIRVVVTMVQECGDPARAVSADGAMQDEPVQQVFEQGEPEQAAQKCPNPTDARRVSAGVQHRRNDERTEQERRNGRVSATKPAIHERAAKDRDRLAARGRAECGVDAHLGQPALVQW